MSVLLAPQDALALQATGAIQTGEVEALEGLLRDHPELANARIQGRRNGAGRTLLHVATDWPGFFPNAPRSVRALIAAGAEVDARTEAQGGETPLHWAASSDDAEVAEALIDAGADLEMPGGSIGTPLDNAVGYSCWHVARLLVQRGARVERLWHAAALGVLPRLNELLASATPEQINQAFWHACSGAQRRTAEALLKHGADINFVPDYARATPLAAATSIETRRQTMAEWLRKQGAT
jgi:ankyrin repeat protein